MTRTEKKLYDGAERHWPGSGEPLVTVYRAFRADAELSLWAAAGDKMRNANNGKWVTVKIGRSGGVVHARDCRADEGRAGFFSKSTECGRHSARSAIIPHRDNVAPADLAALVTCEKCLATLGA